MNDELSYPGVTPAPPPALSTRHKNKFIDATVLHKFAPGQPPENRQIRFRDAGRWPQVIAGFSGKPDEDKYHQVSAFWLQHEQTENIQENLQLQLVEIQGSEKEYVCGRTFVKYVKPTIAAASINKTQLAWLTNNGQPLKQLDDDRRDEIVQVLEIRYKTQPEEAHPTCTYAVSITDLVVVMISQPRVFPGVSRFFAAAGIKFVRNSLKDQLEMQQGAANPSNASRLLQADMPGGEAANGGVLVQGAAGGNESWQQAIVQASKDQQEQTKQLMQFLGTMQSSWQNYTDHTKQEVMQHMTVHCNVLKQKMDNVNEKVDNVEEKVDNVEQTTSELKNQVLELQQRVQACEQREKRFSGPQPSSNDPFDPTADNQDVPVMRQTKRLRDGSGSLQRSGTSAFNQIPQSSQPDDAPPPPPPPPEQSPPLQAPLPQQPAPAAAVLMAGAAAGSAPMHLNMQPLPSMMTYKQMHPAAFCPTIEEFKQHVQDVRTFQRYPALTIKNIWDAILMMNAQGAADMLRVLHGRNNVVHAYMWHAHRAKKESQGFMGFRICD